MKSYKTKNGNKISSNSIATVYVKEVNTNLNNYVEDGRYFFEKTVTPTNIPNGANGWLEVCTDGRNWVKQIWHRGGTLNSNDFENYVRTSTDKGNTWSNWTEFVMKKIQTSTLTVNSNYFSTINVNYVRKMGNIVIIDFRGLVSANIASNASGILVTPYTSSMGTKETGYGFVGEQYGTNSTPCWFYMDSDGNIKLNSVTAGKWVHIHHVFISSN